MNVTLRQLRAFAAVAEAGSFTAAARSMHLTQSAVSVLVQELERELGIRLLDRHTRHVQLSDPGREFLPSVNRMLNELLTAVAGVTDLRDKRKGVLRVAAPQLMACTYMPGAIAGFRREYPDVEVRLTDTLPEHVLNGISNGEVELAVGQDVPVNAMIDRQTLFRDRHWLICQRSHPFASRRSVSWEQIADASFIFPTRDFRSRIDPELDAQTRMALDQPRLTVVSYITTAIGMVAAGLGITVAPTYSQPMVKAWGLVMVKLSKPDFHRDVCVYTAADRSRSPAASAFVEMLHVQGRASRGRAASKRT